jgi:hypothetical protein
MLSNKVKEDLSKKMKLGFDKAREKLIAEEKKNNGYLIVGDKHGNIKKVAAKEL